MSDTASIDRLESTENTTLSARLGAAIAAVPSGRFDGEVTEKLKLCLLDFFACAFESSVRPQARQAAALAPAESGPCTIIGTPAHVAAADAGFANAVVFVAFSLQPGLCLLVSSARRKLTRFHPAPGCAWANRFGLWP